MPTSTSPTRRFDDTPLWLSHHHADQADRCVVITGRHVCRRCLAIYPLTLLVASIVVPVGVRGSWITASVITACLLPFLVDWTVDQLHLVDHSSLRSDIVSAVAAVGLGTALGIHVGNRFDPTVVAPVVIVATIAAAVALIGKQQRHREEQASDRWSSTFERSETERLRHLESLSGVIEGTDD